MPLEDSNNIVEKSPGTDIEAAPAGYCPNCDYPINPGICPERGNQFEADQLARRPRATRRRQQIRRVAALILIIAASIGLHRLYESRLWTRCLPTSWLLAVDLTTSWATDEILRRDINGELSEEQRLAQFRRAFAIKTFIRSPRPISDEFAINVTVNIRPGAPDHSILHNINDAQVFIDGQPAEVPADFMLYKSNTCISGTPMQPGRHIINGNLTIFLGLSERSKGVGAQSTIHLPVEFRHEIIVEEKPISHFVAGRFDESLNASIKQQLLVSICPENRSPLRLNICLHDTSIPIAGKVVMRLRDEPAPLLETNMALGPIVGAYAELNAFELPEHVTRKDAILDIQFTPDLQIAFDAGFTECFAGTVEWHGITLEEFDILNAGGICQVCDPPFDRSPDIARPWNPEE